MDLRLGVASKPGYTKVRDSFYPNYPGEIQKAYDAILCPTDNGAVNLDTTSILKVDRVTSVTSEGNASLHSGYFKYQIKSIGDLSGMVIALECFQADGQTTPTILKVNSWAPTPGTPCASPMWQFEIEKPENRAHGDGRYFIKTVGVSVEMRITDRDDPKKKWADNVIKTAPVYSGKSTGDMVSWALVGADALGDATFSWSAEGPETKIGPSGAGKNDWKIADGDEDTAKDWLDWKPGKYKIRCAIGGTGNNLVTVEMEQIVGVRTEQYLAVATVRDKNFPSTGVSPTLPLGWIQGPPLREAAAIVSTVYGTCNEPSSSYFIPFKVTDRVYVNNRLFDLSANKDPAPAIRPEIPVTQFCGLHGQKHYRGFAACQFKFATQNAELNAKPEKVGALVSDIGFTPGPGGVGFAKGVPHPTDNGIWTGDHGDTEFDFVAKFRVGDSGQTGFANLNGREIPWVFFRFRFGITNGLLRTDFDSGPSSNPNGPDKNDFSSVPTWLIYRRYYDLENQKWKVEEIRVLDENRRPFFSIGDPIPNKPYLLPAQN